jgi:hypothetical protein
MLMIKKNEFILSVIVPGQIIETLPFQYNVSSIWCTLGLVIIAMHTVNGISLHFQKEDDYRKRSENQLTRMLTSFISIDHYLYDTGINAQE